MMYGEAVPKPVGRRAGRHRAREQPPGAFTLIELLVVIAIIALLMAILMPALRRVRNQARAVVCHANLKQWGTILTLYTEDNQGRLPKTFGDALWFLRGPFLLEDDPNRPSVFTGINAKGIACCPMAVKPRDDDTPASIGANSSQFRIKSGSTFEAWEITRPLPRFHGSYGFNEWLFDWRFDADTPAPLMLRGLRPGIDVFQIRGRSRIPLLLDSTVPGLYSFNEEQPPALNEHESTLFRINRHNGHVNGLFLDWSVRKIGLKELWTLKWNMQTNTAGPWTRAGGVQPENWPEWMRNFKDY